MRMAFICHSVERMLIESDSSTICQLPGVQNFLWHLITTFSDKNMEREDTQGYLCVMRMTFISNSIEGMLIESGKQHDMSTSRSPTFSVVFIRSASILYSFDYAINMHYFCFTCIF